MARRSAHRVRARALARRAWRAAVLLSLAGLAAASCERAAQVPTELRVVGGDPEQGRRLITSHGCGACHTVPGVRNAKGRVAPPLDFFGQRAYIAGSWPNRPDNLVRWIQDPPAMEPRTAMPNLGVDAEEARHIAAYLYTLR